jgi:hypothetical protein
MSGITTSLSSRSTRSVSSSIPTPLSQTERAT